MQFQELEQYGTGALGASRRFSAVRRVRNLRGSHGHCASESEHCEKCLSLDKAVEVEWGFVADQDAVEPACFARFLAFATPAEALRVERALEALRWNLQNKDGSWPAFLGDEARRILDHGARRF